MRAGSLLRTAANTANTATAAATTKMHRLNFQPYTLIARETLAGGSDDAPVRRLTFALPPGTSLGYNLGLGMRLKVAMPPGTGAKSYRGDKPRSYSPTSDPARLGSFDLTVKVYPEGTCSKYLDGLRVGETAMMGGPLPPPDRIFYNPGTHIGLLVLGIGITEGLWVAKSELARPSVQAVKLLHACRTTDDVVFAKEVAELLQQYPTRFSVRYIFSRQDPATLPAGALTGRMNPDLLAAEFASFFETTGMPTRTSAALKPLPGTRFLCVGTKAQKHDLFDLLAPLGVTRAANELLPSGPGGPGGD
eukprot:m.88024 g.88024  ORF g.88024 m.88024 type:complete len:305 (+) comp15158_c0_seq2:227-1141(+)